LKFLKLRILPKGKEGLETQDLIFGDNFTQLHGPTGTGKTPLVKSIAYCLGYSVKFRQEIYNRCEAAVLTIQTLRGEFSIKRYYLKEKKIEVEITDPENKVIPFYEEVSYSNYLFKLLGINNRDLISKSGEKTGAYMSSILPLFYVTQDEGYTSVYKGDNSFIRDQFSEMVRLSFSLPEKNSFNIKKNQIQAKQKLESLDTLVFEKRNRLNLLKETISLSRKPSDVEEEITTLEAELERVTGSTSSEEDALAAVEQLIRGKKKRIREVLNELNIIRNRRRGLTDIKADIETEINTLSLNEEARRVFISFGEVCSSAQCQLFSKSSDSYAKNLLYLKDQIKDLENNDSSDESIEVELAKELEILDAIVEEFQQEKKQLQEQSEQAINYRVISDLKLEIFKLHSELVDAKKVQISEEQYVYIINEREGALNSYEAYKTGGKVDLRLSEFKKSLRLLFIKWLGTLKTSNISHDISFKDDFEPILGEETVNQLSGSTGSRTVLAFHAALLELAARNSPFKFLILDAPKQHETENIDLDRYMKSLKLLCQEYNLQIVFSATEYEYEGDDKDSLWEPQYPLDDKTMFMRKPIDHDESSNT
jgi:DNA repair exonuclease SbcCD ATPase subunit